MAQSPSSETPLSFVFENEEGKPAIHILGGHQNELGLRITHNNHTPLKLRGGRPLDESQLTSDGPSSLYVHFNRMLSAEHVRQLRVSSADEFCFERDSFLRLQPVLNHQASANSTWTVSFKVIISDMDRLSHLY